MLTKQRLSFIFLAIFCTSISLLILARPTHAGDIIYVNQNAAGTNDGSSWADAFVDLQEALAIANVSDEIWVAAGTYTPTSDADQTVYFLLKNGVAIYGGFAGSETSRDQRDWNTNQSILSGDLNGDDNNNINAGEPARSDNSYHVILGVNVSGSTVLDGLIITGGNANATEGPDQSGGGIYLSNSSPTIRNTTIIENTAKADGGGLLLYASSPTINNVTIIGNWAGQNSGGAEIRHVDSNPIFVSVSLIENFASLNGGGIHSLSGSPVLLNSTLSSNSAVRHGGGVYTELLSNFTFENVTITDNSADDGGGVFSVSEEPLVLRNTIIANNKRFSGGDFNCSGAFNSYGFNLVKLGSLDGDCILNEVSDLGTDITDQDPLLGPLTDNGGPTRTHALLSDSPAIDGGSCLDSTGNTVAVDQRGYSRPYGTSCDIGAFELTTTVVELPTYLPVTFNDFCAFCEEEPNDVYTKANRIEPNIIYSGWMSSASDMNDYFYFDLLSAQTVALSLTNIAVGHDYNLVLRSADLALVGYSGEVGNSEEHISTMEIPAGKYYIQVHNYGETGSDQPYKLLVIYDD